MKILFITNHYYPKPDPNAKRISGLATNLVNLGNEVHVITNDKKKGNHIINGVHVHVIEEAGSFSKGKIVRLFNHLSFLLKTILIKLDDNSFDYVIATSPSPFNFISGNKLAKRYKAKFVIDIRDVWPEVFVQTGVATTRSLTYRTFKFISKKAYKKADLIFVVTPGKLKLIVDKFPEYASKVHIVSNGFDREFLENSIDQDFSNKISANMGQYNIVYCGNVGLAQNLKPFVEALSKLSIKNINFHILGKGNKLEELLSYSSEIGYENIYYYGLCSENQVYTALQLMDFSYVSLGSDLLVDSVPTKIFESLALGVPVFLTATGDSTEIVKESKLGVSIPAASDTNTIMEEINKFIDLLPKYNENKTYSRDYILNRYSRNQISLNVNEILSK